PRIGLEQLGDKVALLLIGNVPAFEIERADECANLAVLHRREWFAKYIVIVRRDLATEQLKCVETVNAVEQSKVTVAVVHRDDGLAKAMRPYVINKRGEIALAQPG